MYTVPSATKTNVQNIHISNPGGGSAVTITISIGSDAAGTRVVATLSVPSGTPRDFGLFYMTEGEVLQLAASSNNVLSAIVDGVEYNVGLGVPGIGAHGSAVLAVGESATEIVSSSMNTQSSGSAMVVCIGRGNILNFALSGAPPVDNKGNPAYPQIGSTEPYVHPFEDSGTALYVRTGAAGGTGMQVSAISGLQPNSNFDEVSLLVLEVLRGSSVHDFAWNDPQDPDPIQSGNVTTTAPAVLVAFWWGEGEGGTATPNNGFTVLEEIDVIPGESKIQCVMAAKVVSTPGTYNVTWTPTLTESGAQLWLVAIQ